MPAMECAPGRAPKRSSSKPSSLGRPRRTTTRSSVHRITAANPTRSRPTRTVQFAPAREGSINHVVLAWDGVALDEAFIMRRALGLIVAIGGLIALSQSTQAGVPPFKGNDTGGIIAWSP